MEILPGEIKRGEFVNGRSRLVVTNLRLYKEVISWRKRVEFFSIFLEKVDGIEKHILSNPVLLIFGIIIGVVGVLLYTNRPDGALGLLILGGILIISYVISRRQGVAVYAGRSTIYFRGGDSELEKIIQLVEQGRWERLNNISGYSKGVLAPTIPDAGVEDAEEDGAEQPPVVSN